MTEQDIQNLIRIAVSKENIIFRANVGKVKTLDGRIFDTGLPKGFCDLFGFRPDGQIFFIEVKKPGGKVRKEQQHFIDVVKSKGALAGVAYSVDDALKIIEEG
ncbi:VRR-NUC domain-containing protein [Staphylococcus americanisciuri]|uniref:VRR-NUC domain-containing protein n=1 Tax=Staphylococcus americanisciuri TaxID=2973940 RepID=A0ABT2F5U2_9STAP|nr:VRR-NUC domain-containing protein [Staphylococcus americanisciuri]MCS4487215.1 VRR-NUC domain-containing protein [Staphylococcus americanisciuri]